MLMSNVDAAIYQSSAGILLATQMNSSIENTCLKEVKELASLIVEF
jgi:hypothetical protein